MTKLVGILNLTPDSFSDGGRYIDVKAAVKRFAEMEEQGAYMIDIGAQSTRPGAAMITAEDEWRCIKPVLQEVKNLNAKISIDSFHPQTIAQALEYGIYAINDVTGFVSDDMVKLAATSGAKAIFMHSLSVPADKNIVLEEGVDVIEVLNNWLVEKRQKLATAGIQESNMIFDPGIGFGKTSQQSLDIVMNADSFSQHGVEVLLGHSEKSFLSLFTEKPAGQRGVETRIFSYMLAQKGVNYLRVHDVKGNKEAIDYAVQRI